MANSYDRQTGKNGGSNGTASNETFDADLKKVVHFQQTSNIRRIPKGSGKLCHTASHSSCASFSIKCDLITLNIFITVPKLIKYDYMSTLGGSSPYEKQFQITANCPSPTNNNVYSPIHNDAY